MPSTIWGTIATGSRRSGSSTSSTAPPWTRSDFATSRPSSWHQALGDQVGGRVRDKPNMRASAGVDALALQPVGDVQRCAARVTTSRSSRSASRSPRRLMPRKAWITMMTAGQR